MPPAFRCHGNGGGGCSESLKRRRPAPNTQEMLIDSLGPRRSSSVYKHKCEFWARSAAAPAIELLAAEILAGERTLESKKFGYVSVTKIYSRL